MSYMTTLFFYPMIRFKRIKGGKERRNGKTQMSRKRGLNMAFVASVDDMTTKEKAALKSRIERVLSEILSDKYDCNITLKFVPKERAFEDERSKSA